MVTRNEVLVVDDDDELRETLVEVLTDVGFAVRQAENGAIALAALRAAEHLPDVILLDLMMPVMNGWEFRAAQREDHRLAAIPVVVMTASRDVEGLDADHVLRKPASLDDLVQAITRCAGAR